MDKYKALVCDECGLELGGVNQEAFGVICNQCHQAELEEDSDSQSDRGAE